jgi:predicted kinase
MNTGTIRLILTAGPPGAGKSTVSRLVGRLIHCPVIERDTLKTELLQAGIVENDIAAPLADNLLLGVGRDLLAQGFSVVLDGHAANPAFVDTALDIARERDAGLEILFINTAQAARNVRLSQRHNRPSQSRFDPRSDAEVAERFSHLPEWTLRLDGSLPVDSLTRAVLDHLAQ